MVNSCSILTALLVVGTVVLAVPIVPEGIASTGMSEGVGFQPGSRSMDPGSSEPGLPIRTRRHDDISLGPPSAEGWTGSQASRSFQRRADEATKVLSAVQAMARLQQYPLPENYRAIVNSYWPRPGQSRTPEEKEKISIELSTIDILITKYMQQDGPSGTSAEKLKEIRDGFEKGEDLYAVARIAGIPMNYRLS
ncbi:hypothetical protein GG344DRAFT_81498 [Lentinula edodes]|nr:hypothetical protein GG344DRAFT_81498 [Lentinula edodes]